MKLFDYYINAGHGYDLFGLISLFELKTTSGKLFLETEVDDKYVYLVVYNDDFSKKIVDLDGSKRYEEENNFTVENQLYDSFDDLDNWLEDYEIISIKEATEEDFDRWSEIHA